jgi:molecular chaperone DnaK
MSAAGVELGVDLGTSNTVAVMRAPDGRARTLLFDGSPLLPSAVYAEPSGAIVVGRDAVHSARLDPARFEPNPKRRIDDGAVLLGDREVPVVQLLAAVLTRVVDEFRRTVGAGVVPQVTITCPAAWGATRRLVLSDAAAAAGLGPVRLVPEPVAAATYFTQVLGKQVPVGSVVVVHDFGAGTFDASVVARTAGGFEVLAVDGRDDIGGLDVDEAIIGFIKKIAVERDAEGWARLERPSTVEERRARRLLWDDVRVAKERLSRQPAADVNVPMLGIDVHVTREELEGLAQGIVEQTIRVTQGVIRWSKLPEGRLAGVFLVGGSSRMPLVGTLLHRALGEPPVVIDSPELVVAEGSLLAGAGAAPEQVRPVAGPSTGIMPRIFTPSGELVDPSAAGVPVSGPSYGTPPVSGPSYGTPPVSGPSYGTPPVSGPSYGTPVGAPASGAPVSGAGLAAGPVSAPPGRPVSGGAVYGSPPLDPEATQRVGPFPPTIEPRPALQPTPPIQQAPPVQQPPPRPVNPGYRQGQAQPVYPPGVSRPSYPQPQYEQPAYREPAYAEPAYGQGARVARTRGGGSRVLKTVFVTMLLILTPIVCGIVAYRFTAGEWPLP